MQQDYAVAVTHVECFLFVAVLQQHQPAISQHAIAIHQKELDSRGAAFDCGKIFHRSRIGIPACLSNDQLAS